MIFFKFFMCGAVASNFLLVLTSVLVCLWFNGGFIPENMYRPFVLVWVLPTQINHEHHDLKMNFGTIIVVNQLDGSFAQKRDRKRKGTDDFEPRIGKLPNIGLYDQDIDRFFSHYDFSEGSMVKLRKSNLSRENIHKKCDDFIEYSNRSTRKHNPIGQKFCSEYFFDMGCPIKIGNSWCIWLFWTEQMIQKMGCTANLRFRSSDPWTLLIYRTKTLDNFSGQTVYAFESFYRDIFWNQHFFTVVFVRRIALAKFNRRSLGKVVVL